MEQSGIFEKVYAEYVQAVMSLDLRRLESRLGIRVAGETATVPFFGEPYFISRAGVADSLGNRPTHAVCVTLCKYFLLCPAEEPTCADWVSYKDFADAAPFVGGFFSMAEGPVARMFSGRVAELRGACIRYAGREDAGAGIEADVVMKLDALPRVPILLVFHDADEEFPAHCSMLFERRAESYLDMECLAMAASALSDRLGKELKGSKGQGL